MNKILFVVIVGFLCALKGSAQQNYIAPSPDVMNLARLGDTQVNYFTGTPNIGIPLSQIGGKELNVPISLNYNSSGHRVQDIASSVGLGWNLNAGGVVTRVVRGIPDDQAGGMCSTSPTETEPDMYYYVLPGRAGKFFLSGSPKRGYTIPYEEIFINPGICGGTGVWEITDENGVFYRFGVNTNDVETVTSTPVVGGTSTTYISSWYLSEIYSPNKTEKITFTYSIGFSTSNINYYFRSLTDPCNTNTLQNYSSNVTTTQHLVASIAGPSGTASFSWGGNRQDLPGGKSLSTIIVVNSDGTQTEKYSFQYSYFWAGCSTSDCYRLKLDKIFDLAPDPLYVFNYNTTTNLPSRYSMNFDHWGYYNNNGVYSWIPTVTAQDVTAFFGTCTFPDYSGASREPDAQKTLANLITSIGSRGGGTKSFLFEAHQAQSSGSNSLVGGARIKSITDQDGMGNSIVRTFNYVTENNSSLSSGISFHKPLYRTGYCTPDGNVSAIYSHSYVDLFDLSSDYIGYSRVEETVGNGKTVYYFKNYDQYPDDVTSGVTTDLAWERGNVDSIRVFDASNDLLSRQTFTYNLSLPTKAYVNGTSYYFTDQYSCGCTFPCFSVSGTGYYYIQYSDVSRPITVTNKTTVNFDPGNLSRRQSVSVDFEYDPMTYQMIKSTQYDNSQPSTKYITLTKYVSNHDYLYTADCAAIYQSCVNDCLNLNSGIGACKAQCSSEQSICNQTQYSSPPSDPRSAAIFYMYARHQFSTPIEQLAYIQDASGTRVISGSLKMYKAEGTNNALVDLAEVWTLSQPIDNSVFINSAVLIQSGSTRGNFAFDSHYRKVTTYNTYDQTTANLLQRTSLAGIQENYTWNPTNTLVLGTTTTGGVNQRTQSATYKPMVGILTQTDVNGIVTKAEYDIYNRVHILRDNDNNILKMVRYNYQNETPGFKIVVNTFQGYPNDVFTFNISDIAASTGGVPQFNWNFGDGSTATYTGTSINHSYTTAGTYNISLTGTNPEYGSVTRSVQVLVASILSVTLCADGPVTVDLCGVNQPYLANCKTNPPPTDFTTIYANAVNGCPNPYSYAWSYSQDNTNWYALGSNTASVQFNPPSFVGSYYVRCIVTDGCGRTSQDVYTLTSYESTSGCAHSGGIK